MNSIETGQGASTKLASRLIINFSKHTIKSIPTDITKVGHGIAKAGVALLANNGSHKQQIALKHPNHNSVEVQSVKGLTPTFL